MPKLDATLIDYIRQQTATFTTIASNTESVKTAIVDLTKAVLENTKLTGEIKNGQIQFQKQAIRVLLMIIAVLILIIGGLLYHMNVKGADVIIDAAGKLIK